MSIFSFQVILKMISFSSLLNFSNKTFHSLSRLKQKDINQKKAKKKNLEEKEF